MSEMTPEQIRPLRGMRVLVVEDDFLAAKWLERILIDWGCQVVGPTPTLDEANRLAKANDLTGGILDINLRGKHSGDVAETLRSAHRGVFFVTGYSSPAMLPDSLRDVRRLRKPISHSELWAALMEEFLPGREPPEHTPTSTPGPDAD